MKSVLNFELQQTFKIPKVESFSIFNDLDSKTIEEYNDQKRLEQDQLIVRIGDEVEKRFMKILSEFKK